MAIGPPTQAGFVAFATAALSIPAASLPPTAPWPTYAYSAAIDIVDNVTLSVASPDLYTLAVYNLATSNLINFAQDPPGTPNIAGTNPAVPFWQALRQLYKIDSFASGVVQATSDQGTSTTLLTPDFLRLLTLSDLQLLKDPFGRRYLGIAQKTGTLWGVT